MSITDDCYNKIQRRFDLIEFYAPSILTKNDENSKFEGYAILRTLNPRNKYNDKSENIKRFCELKDKYFDEWGRLK